MTDLTWCLGWAWELCDLEEERELGLYPSAWEPEANPWDSGMHGPKMPKIWTGGTDVVGEWELILGNEGRRRSQGESVALLAKSESGWERWKSLGGRVRRDLAGVLKVGMKKDQGLNQHGPEDTSYWILSKHSLISVEGPWECFQSSPMANFHAENHFTFATNLILLSH